MSEATPNSKSGFRSLAMILGIALLAYLIHRTGPVALWTHVKAVGYGLGIVLVLGGLAHLVKTWAWRKTFTCDICHLSWSRSFGMRLVSEAIGQLGLAGKIVGEGARVSLLRSTVPVGNAIAAAALDTGFYIVTSVFVAVVAIVAGVLLLPLPAGLRLYACISAGVLTATLTLLGVAFAKSWRLLGPSFHALERLPGFGDWIRRKQQIIDATERNLLNFHRDSRSAFWSALALNLAAHALALTEIYVILRFLTPRATLMGALVLEGLTKLINGIGAINPGNVGTYEAGNVLITNLFGISAAAGLTLALCRRARALFWAAIGVICLTTMRRSDGERKTNTNAPTAEDKLMNDNLQRTENDTRTGRAVIIVAGPEKSCGDFTPAIAEVGTLPLLLRNILSIEANRPYRILVCASPRLTEIAWSALQRTDRLPNWVEWRVVHHEGELSQVIAEVGASSNGALLIHANGSYQPKILQDAFAWDGVGCLAIATSGQSAGIYFVSKTAARCLADVQSVTQLGLWAKSRDLLEQREVPADSWHRVISLDDIPEAERKLESWLVKPTDGIFARMNRTISIPISRQLIKVPITPNMVTFFVLGVSLASGAFYARGGYWSILLASLLGVAGSILDGCDGEVARIKLQCTRLGCWLDTVCDYIYYVVAFGGMAVGLARSSGSHSYYSWGAALLFGAVTVFIVVSATRQRLSGANPEKILAVWQKNAEIRSSNPLMYLGRQTEFILRRCFLPYALLVFALLNLTKVAFIMAAVGANIAWVIALYCYFDFSRNSQSATSATFRPEATA